MTGSYLDILLFGIFPYVAAAIFFIGTILRYSGQPFTYSSLSSQFLENRQHFWGLVPFHYGLIVILTGHVVGFLVPRSVLAWNARPLRLYILEVTALIFGLLVLIGLLQMIYRRLTDSRVRIVTSRADWILLALLLVQIVAGVLIATTYTWGSSWFAATASPYLWSVLWLKPDLSFIAPMPWLVKVHIAGFFALTAFFPFTRMVHQLVFPVNYLWRKPQMVRWYSRRQVPTSKI
jgi:nitrate reductase gamma subunit